MVDPDNEAYISFARDLYDDPNRPVDRLRQLELERPPNRRGVRIDGPVEIFERYVSGPEKPGDIADDLGLSEGKVKNSISNIARQARLGASEQFRLDHPRIPPLRTPVGDSGRFERGLNISRAKDGPLARAVESYREGLPLDQALVGSGRVTAALRNRFRQITDEPLPSKYRTKEETEELIERLKTDPEAAIRGIGLNEYAILSKKGKILSIVEAVRSLGGRVATSNVGKLYDQIRGLGLPVGKFEKGRARYYFIRTEDLPKLKEVVESGSTGDLTRNSVTQITGEPLKDAPSASFLEKQHLGYVSIRNHVRKLGIRFSKKSGITFTDLVAGCPKAIFTTGPGFYCKAEDRDEVTDYIIDRVKKMGWVK